MTEKKKICVWMMETYIHIEYKSNRISLKTIDFFSLKLYWIMDHKNIINDKTKKLTKWKISPSNGQLNSPISPSEINGIIRRDDRMTRIHLSQRERDHR